MDKFRKAIDPLTGMVTLLDGLHKLAMGQERNRGEVFRDEFDSIIVDTCIGFDTGVWETAIHRGSFVIVAQYPDRDAAKAGHDQWVAQMKEDPNTELVDLDIWNLEKFKEMKNDDGD